MHSLVGACEGHSRKNHIVPLIIGNYPVSFYGTIAVHMYSGGAVKGHLRASRGKVRLRKSQILATPHHHLATTPTLYDKATTGKENLHDLRATMGTILGHKYL